MCVALKSPREGSTDRLRCLPRRLFEAQGGVVLPTWRAARTGFVISDPEERTEIQSDLHYKSTETPNGLGP